MNLTITKEYEANIHQIPILKVFIEKTLEQWGVNSEKIQDIVLASDEAATNIIMHAYKENDDENGIELTLKKKRNRIELIFLDQGRYFDLNEAPKPNVKLNLAGQRRGGFGVFLMNTLMDGIKCRRSKGKNMTFMYKNIIATAKEKK